ncbi:hypothetical protein [Roseisalinus antarcticus]|nr:hypothetical protein [Roseisalinus antarcticus]
MTGLAKFNFKLTQRYPGSGDHRIISCGNPDCLNVGVEPSTADERRSHWSAHRPEFTQDQLDVAVRHGAGACKLAGADTKHRRVSRVFDYADEPHVWHDQRTIWCQSLAPGDRVCDSGFSILSFDHLDEEIARLRNHDGVLDGPACGACGTRVLVCPDEFSLKGAYQRTRDSMGRPIRNMGAPKSIRVLHKPCKRRPARRQDHRHAST